jgi:hypothetical protein
MMRRQATVLLVLLCSAPAAAQERGVEVFGGYTFVHDAKNDISLPAGWIAGGSLQLRNWVSAVVDVSGSHRTEDLFGAEVRVRAYGIFGGGRVSTRLGRVSEFAQLLAGVVRGSGTAFGFTETSSAFALQPGVGIDYPLTRRVGARGQLDARFIRNQPNGNEAGYEYRFSAAIVYRIR